MSDEKSLFIPLKAEWFEAFERGDKDTEYRPYGPRWNERSCRVGRAVVLSCGYGRRRRISGTVAGFSIVSQDAHPAIRRVYPAGELFAAIKIECAKEKP